METPVQVQAPSPAAAAPATADAAAQTGLEGSLVPDSVPDSEAGTISVSIGGNTAAAERGTSHSGATVNAPGAAAAGAGGLEADSAEKAPGLAAAGSLKRQRTVAKRFEALLNGKEHCMVPVGTQAPIAPPEVRFL